MSNDETTFDRRFSDFEKLIDARMTAIQRSIEDVRSTMSIVVDKFSNLHKDYVPRPEHEKEDATRDRRIEKLETQVERLQAWRNYLAGGIAILAFVIGIIVEWHFWK